MPILHFTLDAFKADPPLGCKHASSPNKAHLISVLQANVFDVSEPVRKKGKEKKEKWRIFQLVFRSGIAILDLMLD